MTTRRLYPTPERRPFRTNFRAALKVAAAVLALVMITHLSWNLFAPDLFAMPPIRIKGAIGLVTFIGVLAVMVRFAIYRGRHD